uniref:Enhancer of polycomb-like protein n=1 Tax=Solanum tuberosum TaxID=4113 RepID=M1B5I7_SOLTU
MLFKELHEECYKRNILAASEVTIPGVRLIEATIPGDRLIEEIEDYASEVSFIRSSPKYYRQTESDVEMAMDPSRILYDMDSEDEQWLSKNNFSCSGESKYEEISDEFFEKAMDMFEKVAYARHRDHFAPNELEELMVGVGPMEVVKFIHEHWQNKRHKNGMTLVRHLQVRLH